MISTDRLIFDRRSAVRKRQIEYAKEWEQLHILIFGLNVKAQMTKEQISENCWIYSTDSIFKLLYPFDAIRIGSKIIKENIITEITCQDSSLTAMAGVSLKKSFGLPLEIQIHGDIGSPYFSRNIINKIRLKLARKYLPKADKIRVVSNRIRNYVDKLLEDKGLDKKPEIEIKPISVDREMVRNAPIVVDLHRKYKQFDQIVLMASRLEKEKNISLAIKSWSLVTTHFPKAGLIIVGTGGEEQILKRLVVNGVLEKSVVFEKWANKETLYSYYKTADLFLSTSYFEGYGMALVEAKTAGCPVVSTDVGIAKEEGAIIAEFNPASVSSNIIKVLAGIKRR